jgi:hypothetical protein
MGSTISYDKSGCFYGNDNGYNIVIKIFNGAPINYDLVDWKFVPLTLRHKYVLSITDEKTLEPVKCIHGFKVNKLSIKKIRYYPTEIGNKYGFYKIPTNDLGKQGYHCEKYNDNAYLYKIGMYHNNQQCGQWLVIRHIPPMSCTLIGELVDGKIRTSQSN